MNPESILKYPLVFCAAFLCTYLLTPLIMKMAKSLHMIDEPGGRRLHKNPTPRCGGIAVFLGFHVGCAAIFLLPWSPFQGQINVIWWWHFLIASSALLALGIADDILDLKVHVKLSGQIAVAIIAFYFDIRMGKILGVELPVILDLCATVLWFLVIINAFNLTDGMDGLAAGLAIIAAIGLAGSFMFRHSPGDALVLLAFAGACLAFLRYNFHPARVFLGDSGSMFLGFTLAAVSLSTSAKGTAAATIGVPLLAVGVPIFDAFLAVWRRSVRSIHGKQGADKNGGVFLPDMDHLHHRLARKGLSHRAVVTWLYAMSVVVVSVGLLSMIYNSHALGIYLTAFVVASYVIVRHLARVELWASGEAIMDGLRRPKCKVLAVVVYPPLDILALSLALVPATFFASPLLPFDSLKQLWFDRLPLWVGLPFLAMFIAQTYSRVWSRARVSEYLLVGVSVFGGILMAAGLSGIIDQVESDALFLQILLYAGVAVPLITCIRAFPRAVQDAMGLARDHYPDPARVRRNTIVYGAGHFCTLFLRVHSSLDTEQQIGRHIVGLIDEDANLHGRLVHGHRVLGGGEVLPDIIKEKAVTEIIVTTKLSNMQLQELATAVEDSDVDVLIWHMVLEPLSRVEP